MIKYDKNGEIIPGLLDGSKVLSEGRIKKEDYKTIKLDFEELVELLELNKLYHSVRSNYLKYEIDENLEFVTFTNIANKEISLVPGNRRIVNKDKSILTMDKKMYEDFYELCEFLLQKVKASWDELNEVERFIIKSLEFDNPKSTDEELEDKLMMCKKKYYQYKKSGYIKLEIQLRIHDAKVISLIYPSEWPESIEFDGKINALINKREN